MLEAGADWIHFDVMDNHYVPNLTVGPLVCDALRKAGVTAPIDVHLMTAPVDRLIEDFAAVGATSITIHPEATQHLDRSLRLIREHGCLAGVAFNPATPLDCLPYVAEHLDLMLLMTVNPGFGGQKLIKGVLPKITEARTWIADNQLDCRLCVDGGVSPSTIASVSDAGADSFVVGSALFGSKDYAAIIQALRTAAG